MKRYLLCIALFLVAVGVSAQFARSLSPSVRSLSVVLNGDSDLPPVLRLNSDDELQFAFDEMSHNYNRYTCRIQHCDAGWQPSELFEIDYLDGFNDMPVEEWENSVNTTFLYTTYSFTLPNENVNLKLAGNYKVTVVDDDETPVAEYLFAVLDERVALSATVSGDTDIDHNKTHQQLSFAVHHPSYNISNPANEIKTVVYQNRRTDNCVAGILPTHITGNSLQYVYNGKLIFDAGNEYRRFEITDTSAPGMGVERVSYSAPYYHAELYTDAPRKTHLTTLDENGRYYINTLDGYGSSVEADYLFVHFSLAAPQRAGGDYYLLGDFCGNTFDDSNRLFYDAASGTYRATKLLKMGLYNYAYVWLPTGSSVAQTAAAEGDFYNTSNEYLIFIYHKEFGSRYDKLIGVGRVGTMPAKSN